MNFPRPQSRLTPADKRDVKMKVVRRMIALGRVNLEQRGLWRWYVKSIDEPNIPVQKSGLNLNHNEIIHQTILKNICRRVQYREFQAVKRCFNAWRDPDGLILSQIAKRSMVNLADLREHRKMKTETNLVKALESIENTKKNINNEML